MFAAQLKELGLPGAAASRSSAQANGSNHAIAQVRSYFFPSLLCICGLSSSSLHVWRLPESEPVSSLGQSGYSDRMEYVC